MTEIPIFQSDLLRILGLKHPNSLRTYIKLGKVPPPDVRITQKTKYWYRATLERAGLLEAANPQ